MNRDQLIILIKISFLNVFHGLRKKKIKIKKKLGVEVKEIEQGVWGPQIQEEFNVLFSRIWVRNLSSIKDLGGKMFFKKMELFLEVHAEQLQNEIASSSCLAPS